MTAELSPDQSIIEDHESEQDSAVLKALRAQTKDQSRKIKELEQAAQTARETVLAEVQREASARQVVSDLGFPKMASLVAEKIQGDITPEAVKSFLEGYGLVAQPETPSGTGGAPAPAPFGVAAEVAGVASLGQQLAAAARGGTIGSVTERLAAAQSVDEITKIAAEAGILTAY